MRAFSRKESTCPLRTPGVPPPSVELARERPKPISGRAMTRALGVVPTQPDCPGPTSTRAARVSRASRAGALRWENRVLKMERDIFVPAAFFATDNVTPSRSRSSSPAHRAARPSLVAPPQDVRPAPSSSTRSGTPSPTPLRSGLPQPGRLRRRPMPTAGRSEPIRPDEPEDLPLQRPWWYSNRIGPVAHSGHRLILTDGDDGRSMSTRSGASCTRWTAATRNTASSRLTIVRRETASRWPTRSPPQRPCKGPGIVPLNRRLRQLQGRMNPRVCM